ncbi:MAG: SIS domain-containing protein [Candidatus Omnitrophica bacterium]|nr:SIS domain-containing protein [Candidatus Omnitrophota bacterium]
MDKKISSYFETVRDLTKNIIVTGETASGLGFRDGLKKAISMITACDKRGRKLIFIGNGASASISSHMAADFWKNGRIRAVSFNDAALLTCVSNDIGYSQVFEKPIEMFVDAGDILVAISSSGKSENIINGARMALAKGCDVITLSGFGENNPLRSMGAVNFYVPHSSYGPVEVVHHAICHCLLDTIVSRADKRKAK